MDEFTELCRKRFDRYVDLMHVAPFHVQKRAYMQQAEACIDVYLDYLELHGLTTAEGFGELEPA